MKQLQITPIILLAICALPVISSCQTTAQTPGQTTLQTTAQPTGTTSTANTTRTAPCDSTVYREFDFWVGDWAVENVDGVQLGTNTIVEAENGCLLTEHWTSVSGGTGTSMNYWDPAEEQWKQVWVSSNGSVGYFDGGIEEGAMVLLGEIISSNGSAIMIKGTWTPLRDGRVRQHFEQSNDEGATWKTWFDGYYKKM